MLCRDQVDVLEHGYHDQPRDRRPRTLHVSPQIHGRLCESALRGAGLWDLLPSVLALIFLTGVLLALSTTRFRKSVV